MKNKIIKNKDHIFRVLEVKDNQYLVVDCKKLRMPKWVLEDEVKDYIPKGLKCGSVISFFTIFGYFIYKKFYNKKGK